MRVRIAVDFDAEMVTIGSDCVTLNEFILYLNSLQDEKTRRAMKRKLRRIINMYLYSFTKQKRTTPVMEMVKIPRVEYEQMKADIAFLMAELKVAKIEIEALRAENIELRAENAELRHELSRYRALYGPLPPENKN